MIWIENGESSKEVIRVNHIDSEDGTLIGIDAMPPHEWRTSLAECTKKYGHMDRESLLDVITGYAIAMETH